MSERRDPDDRAKGRDQPRSIAYLVGARPNLVKVAPVLHELRARLPHAQHVLVHSGQHYDRELSEIFLEELELPAPDYFLSVGSGSHGEQIGRAIERIEAALLEVGPDLLIVAGDVNSTLAGAIVATKLLIPLAHIESGLRSFDRTMPEEVNRLLVDQVSDWCFIHSPEAADNLRREGIAAERIFFVGNTMIDTLERLRPRIEASDIHERLNITPGEYALVTLHRPRLTDGPLLAQTMEALERLGQELPVVFPMHPRTRARLEGADLGAGTALRILNPAGYVDFLALEARAAAVITDSGGIQEETTYLGVPCFTLRDNTERPVTITRGTNRLLGLDPGALAQVPSSIAERTTEPARPEGWDGHAAERVADVLVSAGEPELSRSNGPELTLVPPPG